MFIVGMRICQELTTMEQFMNGWLHVVFGPPFILFKF
jgi:hypothetical protein